jgi:signal transduction histidine kinase
VKETEGQGAAPMHASALHKASLAIFGARDPAQLPESIVRAAREVMSADSASLLLVAADGRLAIAEADGLDDEVKRTTRITIGEGIAGRVAAARAPAIINGSAERRPEFKDAVPRKRVKASIVYPLVWRDRLLGLLTFNRHDEDRPYASEDLENAGVLASQVMLALENARLARRNATSEKLAALGELAGGLAHEINTPLQYVGDNITFLHRVCSALADVARDLEELALAAKGVAGLEERATLALAKLKKAKIGYLASEGLRAADGSKDGVARVANILVALKQFSQSSGGEPTLIDLNDAIRATITVAEHAWRPAADLELRLDPALPRTLCVPDEMRQVILNLIVNAADAIRAVGRRGRIVVSTRAASDETVLSVSDTGSGIPESIRARIFDPFFTTKAVGAGTGNGLAFAHGVVERHRGTISFETALGEGSTFIVRLPCAAATREEPTA